ncbi:MAG: excinuclease ABC subunit C, partial [bacterium]|nr:excinuclease ABC subunit C [bacterium]
LQKLPQRMECYDISNFQGKEAVGSMVCFLEGEPAKKSYRKFKIKTVHQPNDYEMMREVLKRRFLKIEEKGWVRPDLIVVDGGRGQLGVAQKVLEGLEMTGVDLISLAKKKEGEKQDKVFIPGRKNPILLKPRSSVLHLLMQIRDEAHRFAVTYHRKLRSKKVIPPL